jgi:glycosyltransferase involved in cell wall biosynthesis
MRTLFISIVPSPYQRDLFAALAARSDVNIHVCYLESESPGYPWPQQPLAEYEEVLPGKWIGIGGARVHWNRGLPDPSEFDIVVLNSYTSMTAQWVMRKKLNGTPWCFWGERLGPRSTGSREWVRQRLLAPLKHASGIVGIGSLARTDYQSRFPGLGTYCVPYHCNLNPFLSTKRIPDSAEVRFLFCGVLSERKGVDLLIAAFDRLIRNGIKARLELVGQEAQLADFLKDISAEARSRITYHGFQAPARLPEFFGQADVFVLPSRWDGWGVVVNQALGAGLALIASDAVGAAHDLIEPESNGLRFANGDTEALDACMDRLARNPALARQWGEASRRKAADWSPERGAERWVEVMRALVEIRR